jgi:hypothetical protein
MASMHREVQVQTVVIANGATASAAVSGRNFAAFGLILPGTFSGSALTFSVSDAFAGTYQTLYDKTGTAVTIATVTQGRSYDLPPEVASFPYFKIVSGSAEGGARTLLVCCKT